MDGCRFSHGLPHWDATDPAAYDLGDPPESATGRAETFAASACRVTFVGHFDRWPVATPAGVLPWHGGEAILRDPGQRYLVAVAAVCDGWCAVHASTDARRVPHRLARVLSARRLAHASAPAAEPSAAADPGPLGGASETGGD